MTTEITNNEVKAVTAIPEANWGGAKHTDTADIIIPRLMLMQGQSDAVKKRKAMYGDIIDSLSGQALGQHDKPVEIIPFFVLPKYWIVSDRVQKEWVFKKRVPYLPENAAWRYEETDAQGAPMVQNILCMDFLCMVAGKLQEFPYSLSFRKTGTKVGKKLSTHFQKCEMRNVPAAKTVFKLGAVEESKNGNTYYVFTLEEGREANSEELAAAWKWFQDVNKSNANIKLDEGDEEVAASAPASYGSSPQPPRPSQPIGDDQIPF